MNFYGGIAVSDSPQAAYFTDIPPPPKRDHRQACFQRHLPAKSRFSSNVRFFTDYRPDRRFLAQPNPDTPT
ncbi:MAG: hypothetical protein J6J65_09970, partial [Opitutales bacterium]|nr:hypothetical protein [Opitutales bacterium]